MNEKDYYVYIMANGTNVAIYTGVTNNLQRRVFEHRNRHDPEGYTAKNDIHKLVYYEHCGDVKEAIAREKQIKGWNRARKNKLIEKNNPEWKDLYDSIFG